MEFKIKYKTIEQALRANRMFELKRQATLSFLDGKFRAVRTAQKELAKEALKDFDTFTTLPNIRFVGIPLKDWFSVVFKSLRFKIFKFFTRKTPEEKLLIKKYKAFLKTLTKENKTKNTINVNTSNWYY